MDFSSQLIPLPYYTEGPAIDSEGNVYCTTLSGGTILKFTEANDCSSWARSECPNGQFINDHDEHLVCDSKASTVSRYSRDGKLLEQVISGTCKTEKISVPNDLVQDLSGGIYFTDSIRSAGKLCYISADGRESIVAAGLDYPNGLVLSPDNKAIFLAESYKNRILVIRLRDPGIAEDGYKLFAALPSQQNKNDHNLPDGIAMDSKGQLWVAHYGMQALQVISPEGKLIRSVPVPFPLVSNVTIQKDEKLIIVTGGFAEPGPGALLKLTLNE